MKTLRIDEKWSVKYDQNNNDRPMEWVRHGVDHHYFKESNSVTAMFYALLEKEQEA